MMEENNLVRPYFGTKSVETIRYSVLAERFGTPLYITVLDSVAQRIECYKNTLREHFPDNAVYYAVKANGAPPILNAVLRAGGCVDVVSAREAQLAIASGFSSYHVCFSGVGKTQSELDWALEHNVHQINCEHLAELDYVLQKNEIKTKSTSHDSLTHVGLRLNPCIEADTHPHLLTGALNSKFGVTDSSFEAYLLLQKKILQEDFQRHFRSLKALHVHVGSQLQAQEFFPQVVSLLLNRVVFCAKLGIEIKVLDLGGGLKVDSAGWKNDHSDIRKTVNFQCETLKKLSREHAQWSSVLIPLWGENFENLTVALEPGRSVVASSTVLLSQILYIKQNTPTHTIAICDSGMNDFPRPAIYGAKHEVVCVDKNVDSPTSTVERILDSHTTTISGPVCESACKLAELENFPKLNTADFVLFLEAGAYCYSMASHYNQRSLPAQVFFESGKLKAHIEKREPEIPKVIMH
jgi:diaminopimelate decarboxylase